MDFRNFKMPYEVDEDYKKRVAYFCMEFGIDQPLKIYSGGLGFLAGSHMRSAYNLKQDLVGIGILWKYGYYDQTRNQDRTLNVSWVEKIYNFLEDTGIKFQIKIHSAMVWVKAWYLAPEVFGTAPVFLLSTDLPENDYVSQVISHRLYDANEATKIAQYILLGKGGARLLEELNLERDIYHLNEAHGLPAAFYLLDKYKNLQQVKDKLVFTTHTPEEAGNEKHGFHLCRDMDYFSDIAEDQVREIAGIGDGEMFDHSLCALRMSHVANGVSKLHGEVSREMWGKYPEICEIKSITNAQDFRFWADEKLYRAKDREDNEAFDERKKVMKHRGFKIVADEAGKIFKTNVLTIVWARRFAGYKRADLLLADKERFHKLLTNEKYPVQIIWAGKPYPLDYPAISTFDKLVHESKKYKNMAVLTGYEIYLSKRLKRMSDVWLNNPRVPREASGTSGMTAAMNGAINFSTYDGWIPEFARHGENSFIIPQADYKNLTVHEQDMYDLNMMYDILEQEILPTYYEHPEKWRKITQQGMDDVRYRFAGDRMADEYYKVLYQERVLS